MLFLAWACRAANICMVEFPKGEKAQVLDKWKPMFSLQNLDQTWNNLKITSEKSMRAGPECCLWENKWDIQAVLTQLKPRCLDPMCLLMLVVNLETSMRVGLSLLIKYTGLLTCGNDNFTKGNQSSEILKITNLLRTNPLHFEEYFFHQCFCGKRLWLKNVFFYSIPNSKYFLTITFYKGFYNQLTSDL